MKKIYIFLGVLFTAYVLCTVAAVKNSHAYNIESARHFETTDAILSEIEQLQKQIAELSAKNDKLTFENTGLIRENTDHANNLLQTNQELEMRKENMIEIIRQVCNSQDFDYRIAIAVAIHESGLNPYAVNENTNGTFDYGLFQFNSVTLECYAITEEVAYDPVQSTAYFCLIINNLMEKYDGDLYYVLRCYAAGETGAANGGGYAFADDIFKQLGATP